MLDPIVECRSNGGDNSPTQPTVRLSVIVAAYNVEKYIGQCLTSVLSQLPSNDPVELVVVVDGATDGTLALIRNLARGHVGSRINIICQPNSGASAARNVGLDAALGEYVTFLDGDDFWLPGYWRSVSDVIKEREADIVEYDALLTEEDGTGLAVLKIALAAPGTQTLMKPTSILNIFRCYPWARVYRKDLFNTNRFPCGCRYQEDAATIPWIYWQAKTVMSCGQPLLGYRQRPTSIVHTPRLSDISDLNRAAKRALGMHESTGDEYWLEVAVRMFQQSCSRVSSLPLKLWPAALKTAAWGVLPKLPANNRLARQIMVVSPFVYTTLLRLKRYSCDLYAKRRMHIAYLMVARDIQGVGSVLSHK